MKYNDKDGTWSSSVTTQLDGGRPAGRLQIKVEAGDDEQSLAAVTVVQPLEVRGVVAMVTPPAYAHLPASPVRIAERPVMTAQGSEIELQVSFNKPLDPAKGATLVSVDAKHPAPPVKWAYPAGGQAVGTFALGESFPPHSSFRFKILATDTDGLQNAASPECRVNVLEDLAPTVHIEVPQGNEERTPDASFPVKAKAGDDYGIELAEMVVKGASPSLASKTWTIPLLKGTAVAPGASWTPAESTVDSKQFHLDYQWSLEKLEGVKLKSGDVLEFSIRVKDNYDFNGHTHDPVNSETRKITIISHDQLDANAERELAEVRQEIGKIKSGQDSTKSENETQAKETAEKKKFDDAHRETVGRLAGQQSNSTASAKQQADKLKDLARRLDENKAPEKGAKEAAKDVAEQLDQTAEGPMKQAGQDLNKAKETKADPKGRPSSSRRPPTPPPRR